jgi:hypothetical protein
MSGDKSPIPSSLPACHHPWRDVAFLAKEYLVKERSKNGESENAARGA